MQSYRRRIIFNRSILPLLGNVAGTNNLLRSGPESKSNKEVLDKPKSPEKKPHQLLVSYPRWPER